MCPDATQHKQEGGKATVNRRPQCLSLENFKPGWQSRDPFHVFENWVSLSQSARKSNNNGHFSRFVWHTNSDSSKQSQRSQSYLARSRSQQEQQQE